MVPKDFKLIDELKPLTLDYDWGDESSFDEVELIEQLNAR